MSRNKKILILDVSPSNGLGGKLYGIVSSSRDMVVELREESRLFIESAPGGILYFDIESHGVPDLVCISLSPESSEKIDGLVKSLRRKTPNLPIIVVVEDCKPDEAISLLKLGATDFITPPLKAIDVLPRVWRLMQQVSERSSVTHILKEKIGLKQIVGDSQIFVDEINKIPLIAKCDSTVLISGESGTGKELYARAIHYLGPRSDKPFVPVNCGAVPADLVENELFGHVRGAFTSAATSQPGLIQDAEGGTIFLDEVDCLPLNAQVKFLRFLQDRVYRRLGSTKMCHADVRVVAATNMDLSAAVIDGGFRKDLFYRLNIIPSMLPPLRQRIDDIALLARHFLDKYTIALKKEVFGFTPEVIQKLRSYEWPGNVRELENVIERAVVFCGNNVIDSIDIVLACSDDNAVYEPFQQAKARIVTQFEQNYIHDVLLANEGNITRAAKMAKKNRRAFWALIRKHNIDVQDIKSNHAHKAGQYDDML